MIKIIGPVLKISVVLIIVLIIIVVIYAFVFNHSLKIELVNEISIVNLDEYEKEQEYFFIKDSAYNGFYDGVEKLKNFCPDYKAEELDLDMFTYIVSINGRINSITYSGRNCKRRTVLGFPDVYTAIVNYSETNDSMVRIYKVRKINIDYDYHQ